VAEGKELGESKRGKTCKLPRIVASATKSCPVESCRSRAIFFLHSSSWDRRSRPDSCCNSASARFRSVISCAIPRTTGTLIPAVRRVLLYSQILFSLTVISCAVPTSRVTFPAWSATVKPRALIHLTFPLGQTIRNSSSKRPEVSNFSSDARTRGRSSRWIRSL